MCWTFGGRLLSITTGDLCASASSNCNKHTSSQDVSGCTAWHVVPCQLLLWSPQNTMEWDCKKSMLSIVTAVNCVKSKPSRTPTSSCFCISPVGINWSYTAPNLFSVRIEPPCDSMMSVRRMCIGTEQHLFVAKSMTHTQYRHCNFLFWLILDGIFFPFLCSSSCEQHNHFPDIRIYGWYRVIYTKCRYIGASAIFEICCWTRWFIFEHTSSSTIPFTASELEFKSVDTKERKVMPIPWSSFSDFAKHIPRSVPRLYKSIPQVCCLHSQTRCLLNGGMVMFNKVEICWLVYNRVCIMVLFSLVAVHWGNKQTQSGVLLLQHGQYGCSWVYLFHTIYIHN